jgi:hypothetical protein
MPEPLEYLAAPLAVFTDEPDVVDSALPKYFFHVYHNEPEIDYEGEKLPDMPLGGKPPSWLAKLCKV